ncbi:HD-GYP domain-containing protein [Gluconobacter sp. GP1]|uniref:HD-GYP domain-containing protein n=1 Tax=unclassified Gluconobacter TaxID=2644261 RepID=UPI00293F744C|nr:HD domain-containing phosphohydrolase [Gluconobacter sp. GP1]
MPELQTLLKEVVKLPASYRRQGAPLASLLAQVAKGDDGHGQRVGRLAGLLGYLAKTGLSSSALELAGRLHDAGKLLLPDSLLKHPGMFNDRQMLVMRQHPSLGLGALFHLSADIPTLVHEAVLLHHERHDGEGYPFGLKGKAIPLAARIIGLADVIDALLSARAYKGGWSARQVKAFLQEQAGGAFDPDLVSLALASFDDLLAIRRSIAQPVQGYQPIPGQSPVSSRTLSFRNDLP